MAFMALLLVIGVSPAHAVLWIQRQSPANGTVVTPGARIPVTVAASGAVAGISRIYVSGERDPEGAWDLQHNPSPPTNSITLNHLNYLIPSDATPGEALTLSARVEGFADSPVIVSITLYAPADTGPDIPEGSIEADEIIAGVYDPTCNLFYLTNADQGHVDIYDPTTNSITGNYDCGSDPRDIEIGISDGYLAVPNLE